MSKVFGKYIIVITLFLAIIGLIKMSNVKALDDYTVTVNEETVNNMDGTFDFKIKFYQIMDVEPPAPIQSIISLSKTSETRRLWIADGVKYNGVDVSGTYTSSSNDWPTAVEEFFNKLTQIDVNGSYETFGPNEYTQIVDKNNNSPITVSHNNNSLNLYIERSAWSSNVNQSNISYDLYVKTVVDPDANKQPYDLYELPEGVVKKADGEYEFSLANSKSVTFKDLTYGVKFTIEQKAKEGWELVSINGDTSLKKVEDEMEYEGKSFTFLNRKPVDEETPPSNEEPKKEEPKNDEETPTDDNKKSNENKITKVVKTNNPQTGDKIMIYIAVGVLSLVIISGLIIYLIKAKKKVN